MGVPLAKYVTSSPSKNLWPPLILILSLSTFTLDSLNETECVNPLISASQIELVPFPPITLTFGVSI